MTFLTIFRKELKDTLRDRRTIIAMVVIPLLIMPLIMGVMIKVQSSLAEKAEEKELNIALVNYPGTRFLDILVKHEDLKLINGIHEDSVRSFIRNDSLHGAYVFSDRFQKQVDRLEAGRLKLYYKSKDDEHGIKKRRLMEPLEEFEDQLLMARFSNLNLNKDMIDAVNPTLVDITTKKERIGQAVGGFLPYIFVIFCFIGAMYPAIDLGAGEKERGTLETLLTAPVDRFQILIGKFGVVVLTGVTAALLTTAGLYIGLRQAADIPPEIEKLILSLLQTESILLLFSLLLPLAIFFAGILLSLSIFAKSFKEAQSIITPFNILVILPAALGLMPGIKLDTVTAAIPVLNVSLATKEIMAGTIEYGLLGEVYLSLIVLAGLSLFIASRVFLRESVIFRI